MRLRLKCWLVALSCLALLSPEMAEAQTSSQYLPMFEGAKWVLRNSRQASAVEFEIPHRDGDGYRFVSRNPWGTSEWTLVDQGGAFAMTQYGAHGKTMPLAERPVWVDFNRPARGRWNNMLGTLEISSRSVTVKTASNTYSDCVQLRHTPKGGSALIYTFAPGVGFVQFGEGSNAFVLDESSSNLPAGRMSSFRPAAPVPSRGASASKTTRRGVGGVLIGLTPNRLATEPNVPENLIKRYNQTVDLGVSFVVGNSTWKELEPRSGQYSLDSLNYLISSTAPYGLPLSYTLRIIDTIHKNVPDDLQRVAWNHPRMKERVERLMETLAPVIRGHVRWFMFGYEVDGYMHQHPREAAAFAELYQVAAARLKQLVPGIQVSTTVAYMNIDQLDGRLAPLNRQLDFLALTYSPLQPGWTVEDPSTLPGHFEKMKRIAGGRKIVLQEIAYPTSPLTKGSPDRQATFYELALREFAKGDGTFAAANFMMLADLSDEDADRYTSFYGMKGQSTFRAVLQTLGLHDVNGRPKPALRVLEKYLQKDAR